MPKAVIVVLVLIAVLFAVGIGLGARQKDGRPAKCEDSSPGSLSALSARIDTSSLDTTCLQGDRFIVPSGQLCKVTIRALPDKWRLTNIRSLKLSLPEGGAADFAYDRKPPTDASLKDVDENLDRESKGTLPTDCQKTVVSVVDLGSGGELTLKCSTPSNARGCVIAIQ